jgi:TetR/AcrR family transcriptional regulator, cholesterol catabolism regulator
MMPAAARPAAAPARKPRVHNRHDSLLAAAARVFCEKGYAQATMRDIAAATDMNAGSIYYHFPSKGELLLAVYAEGVGLVSEAIEGARSAGEDPWGVLEAAARKHLEMMLGTLPGTAPFARVFVHIQPHDFPPEQREALIALRHDYEACFKDLVADLPLPRGTDRSLLRLQLIGALNHVPIWWKPGGRKSLAAIARTMVRHLRQPLEVGQ